MKGLPKFSVENPILISVLMWAILAGGAYSALTLVREMFPESRPNQVSISVLYPGATPAEVEKGVALKIEEAIKDVEDIEKVETNIQEGICTVMVTMTHDAGDLDRAVNDFKTAVDTIPRDELPEEAEEIRVVRFEPKLPVISISLYGDVDEKSLKDEGRKVKDELLLLPGISDVALNGIRKAEIAVEVSPEKLIEYGLSLSQVSEVIRRSNLDLPGGQVKTTDQNVAVRTLGEKDQAVPIGHIIVKTNPDGAVVRVRDLGEVLDTFEDIELRSRVNGKSGVSLIVYKAGDQDAIEIAKQVRAYAAGRRGEPLQLDRMARLKKLLGLQPAEQQVYNQASAEPLPEGVRVRVHADLSRFIDSRLDLLRRNGLWGLALVFLSLLVFLNWRVAFWTMMGLVLSVCGALMLMSIFGGTLNLISMFGLIVVLGLIVDDAIVVAENVFARVERGENPRTAAVEGTVEVIWPVTIAVATTVAAFAPLLFIEGRIGDFMKILPIVVSCALMISLVEALLILPSHLAEWLKPVQRDLAGGPPRHWIARWAAPFRELEKRMGRAWIAVVYERLLRLAASHRYVSLAAVSTLLIISGGMIAGRRVPFVFVQKMDAELLIVSMEMPVGTPARETERAMRVVENAALKLPEVETVQTLVGSTFDLNWAVPNDQRSHLGQMFIELKTVEHRTRSSESIVAQIREETANIPGVNSLRFQSAQGGPVGAEIELQVTGPRISEILEATKELKVALAEYAGVFDIDDDFEAGRREVQIELLDSARPLGITTQMLATELRGAFYGLEARTLQRGSEDVDIRVRFPADRRRQIHELESMWVATPAGGMVPLTQVARIKEGRGYSAIRRVDQRRAIVITADVDHSLGNPEEIARALGPSIAHLGRDYPGMRITFEGNKRETAKSMSSLYRDFVIALALIFIMLAGLFKNYVQPLIVLTVVPFGMIGAVGGHFVMGFPMTMLSMIGVVALTGIIVNDGLILVSFINAERARGASTFDAVITGGKRRLRPIVLTSLTTVLGLAPILLETSWQAQILIPMAISISFGLAFGTVLTLVVVPCIYLAVEDLRWIGARIWHGPQAAPVPGR